MVTVEQITDLQAERIIQMDEGQFSDLKAIEIEPGKLTKHVSAFANSDGGDLYIGIKEISKVPKIRFWEGFADMEAANGHFQIFEKLFPLGTDFQYEFLRSDGRQGLVLHAQVNKTAAIMIASNRIPYIRRNAQSLPVDTPEMMRRLEFSKGVTSFENETTNVEKEAVTESDAIKDFIREVIPNSEPEPWLRKQKLLQAERPTVAGVLLFADEPQAVLPKRCGIKVYRYKTKEAEGSRESMAFVPKTVEGCLYNQIMSAVALARETVESIPRMGAESLEEIKYPPETLHEIITNAIIHRDYSIADDVHIRIFDNRIEVQSPGRLPAHVTIKNILDERFARNGAVVRILNKFADPPNKDVGEGLNTAFTAMLKLGLKRPAIEEKDNSVLVTIKHESLASPEEAIMDFLETYPTIKNSQARAITFVSSDFNVKNLFGRMVKKGLIEQVPGTRTSNTAYRKLIKLEPDVSDELFPAEESDEEN